MATSGSKSITVTSYDTLKFSWSESSQSIANNSTTVSWKLELISGGSGRIDSSAPKSWSVTVNGTKYSGTNYIGIANNATKTLASGTTTIAHNADGTKTFSYSFSQQIDITYSGSWVGTKSGSGTGTLDTIARKSSLSVSNGTLGTALNLTVSKQSSDFTHTITYKCGSAAGTVCTKSSSTSVAWNTSNGNTLSLASQNTTGTSVSVTFTITTYNGNTSLGSSTKTITMTMPEDVKPSCSISVSDAMGYAGTYGGYLKGLSKFSVIVAPTLAYSSPITSYNTSANDVTYTKETFTTDVIKKSGSYFITAKVTDKRGRTGTTKKTVTVLDYNAPVISKIAVLRCNSDGTENPEGAYVKVTYSGTITSLSNKNTAKYQLKYKKTAEDDSYYQTKDLSTAYTVTNGTYVFAADTGSSYDIQIVATDAFSSTTRSTTASSGFTVMHFNAEGTGMGLGKVSEFAGLDVGFETRFRDKVQFDKPAETRVSLKAWCFDDATNTTNSSGVLRYPGLAQPDGTTLYYVRTTQQGLLPYESNSTNGSGNIGTSGWPFASGHFKNLYANGNAVADYIDDSGWKTATLTSDFVKYDGKDDNIPQYKKIGKLVEVRGAVSPKTAIAGSDDAYTIFTLPAGYRPPKQVSILSPGSGANQWLLTITAAGLVRFARYNNGAGYVNASTSTWLAFHAMYFVD